MEKPFSMRLIAPLMGCLLLILPAVLPAQETATSDAGLISQLVAAAHETRKKDLGMAIEQLNMAINLKRKQQNGSDLELAEFLHTQGGWYYTMQNYLPAVDCFKESLSIRKANFGEIHPEIGKSLNNLGLCYAGMTDYSTAIQFYETSIAVKEACGDTSLAGISTNYFNMGNCSLVSGYKSKIFS